VTLVDAGPLVALIDADEADHEACVLALGQLARPLVTTWPAFTEAMDLLSRAGGAPGRRALWTLVFTDRLAVADLDRAALKRAAAVMDKYADRSMDLADATLVALAEIRNDRRIFTLDEDFTIYRIHGRTRFDIVPR
jgi:predicted nucleic acid-binding protein